jgi:ABC-type sugar transport system permease subunit
MAAGNRGTVVQRHRWRILPMLLPAIVLYGGFVFYPALRTFYLSLTDSNGISAPHFVGLANFRELRRDPLLHSAVVHTAEFVVMGGAILFPLALFFAYVTENLKGGKFYRFFILAPIALSVTTAGLLWKFALDPNFGLVDAFFRVLGIGGLAHFQWLGDTSTAMLMVVLATIWSGVGIWMLFLISAMQRATPELREAAAVDGATRFQIFRDIVFPLAWPVMKTLILLWIVLASQAFGFIIAMTNGGPLRSTEVVGTYLYETAFNDYRFGYASAIAVALALTVLAISVIARILGRRAESVST